MLNKLHMLKLYSLISLNIYETVTTSRRMNILSPLRGLSCPVLLLHPASLFYWWRWGFRQEPKPRSCYFVMAISGHFSPIVSQTLNMISLSFSLSFILSQIFPQQRSAGEENGNPFQYSCLRNLMDRGAWLAGVHGVTKRQTWLSD